MSVNFTDYPAVAAAYDAVLNKEANWLLLKYAQDSDDTNRMDTFDLVASGSQGLPELKREIEDPLQIFIAFYREGNDGFILLNIIPENVSGVRRARALVHSRRIGVIFQQHSTTLTVDHLSNLTPKSIKTALAAPDAVHVIQVDRVTAEPTIDEMGNFVEPGSSTSSPTPPSRGSGSMFSSLLRRKKKPEFDKDIGPIEPFSLYLEDVPDTPPSPPPKPPPKDKEGRRSISASYQHPRPEEPPRLASQPPAPRPPPQIATTRHRSNSDVDYSVVNHRDSSSSDDVVVVKPESPLPRPRSPAMKKRSVTMPSKWNNELVADPAERARRRELLKRERELQEQKALEEEAQRQRRLQKQKEALLREQEEEEEQRRISIENELRRATTQRRRREELERREEEQKQRELEQRKNAERERRMEEHRRLEEWRKEQAAQAEKTAQLEEQTRRREEEERKKKIQLVSSKIKSTKADADLVTGWVTMQTGDSLVWRRRYFKFIGSTVFFYRSQKERDLGQVLDQVDLRGQVRALREWNEGYEDLKAIPFSFAVEFNDGREPWSMFSDSEEEKFKLLGLLHTANTLSIGSARV
ncbi:ADF-H domain-containing protein [Mycena sanguinolenta]|uniref:ADF-H domain-containing protein n=1 Tax=Mycena sanguinolenta TaxID=230812 RepID=A0A8H6Z161_9AGAR|nr:ADF-H domain-containing protein [Mycena sanguinolenta]